MAALANRRSAMTLFTEPGEMAGHRVRIVLAEKGISADVVEVDPTAPPEDLVELNPYATVPTLVDRDLVLYEDRVIAEYLDERFPHPPLMPVDPVARANVRQLRHRIRQDWEPLVNDILQKGEKTAARARKELREGLVAIGPLFDSMTWFMSDEFGLADVDMAALLWRLPALGIEIPEKATGLIGYSERLFQRPAVRESLDEVERDMRSA